MNSRRPFKYPKAVYVLPLVALVLSFCGTPKKSGKVSYVEEKQVPGKIAVMPAVFAPQEKKDVTLDVKPGSEDAAFVTHLVRGVINNQLSGKGYATVPLNRVNQKLDASGKDWQKTNPEVICELLNVDGLIFPEVLSATMVKAVAYDQYAVEVRLKMVNSKGKLLGTWTESASKRKISIPTGAIGALATIAAAAMDDPAKQHMRLVVYDWGWKVSQFLPDSPHKGELPEVLMVTTNVDKGIFGIGDQIEVEVSAEKGLTCTFDVGDFKKGISLPETTDGLYKGFYGIRKGEQTEAQPLTIHLTKPNGVERIWQETGGAVTIDAVPPPGPTDLKAEAGQQGVSLSWVQPDKHTVLGFMVERGEKPFGDFKVLANTGEIHYLDAEVTQGSTHYYRVRSVDSIGNSSDPTQSVKVVMPFFEEVALASTLKGVLVPGLYLAKGECVVPEGETFTMGPGTKVRFSAGAALVAKGALKAAGSPKEAVLFEGEGWKGIQVTSQGRAEIADASMQGCSPCMQVQGGLLDGSSTILKGPGKTAVAVDPESHFTMSDLHISGFETGVALRGGRGKLEKSTITENDVGVVFEGGVIDLVHNNIYQNREKNVVSLKKLVLEGNYLGTTTVEDAGLRGDILVTSLLNAPFPHGRKVVLVSDQEITPEAIAARFETHKKQGIESFKNRKFGDAYQSLNEALSLKDDQEVYLYKAYTEMILGEEDKLEKTLAQGIETFPYEVKLYQIYAKHLTAQGENEKALALLDKALRMNPGNETLKIMKQGLMAPATTGASGARPQKAAATAPERPTPSSTGPGVPFDTLKADGIKAFKAREFKKAAETLTQALSRKADNEVYLYLAYTQMNLEQKAQLEDTLDKGIAAFPEDVRLYQLYAKHLVSTGDTEKALFMIQKGLELDPDNQNLKFMKAYLEKE
ncbi:MAG: hypothetical protein ACLFUT_08365 [Desulfobacteraceae bacterium]